MAVVDDTQLLNVLVRMVVPMKREFGRALDVQQFRSDSTYASSVVQQALTSQVDRLREYALFVDRCLHSVVSAGSRNSAARPKPEAARHSAPLSAAKQAARQLLNQVGPVGEFLAIEMERVSDVDAARLLAARACRLVAEFRGERAAQTYREQLPVSLV